MFLKGRDPNQGGPLSKSGLTREKGNSLRVGGQAVIEGVMMRSPRSMAIAVRRPNGEIVVKKEGLRYFSEKSLIYKIPLIRGVWILVSALVLGIRALNFSAQQAISETEGEKEIHPWTIGITFFLAIGFGLFLFFLVPLFMTRWVRGVFPVLAESGFLFNLTDGIIRMIIFLGYLWIISLIHEIRRVFQYHGAEHKSIFAFESGEALEIDRVKRFGTLHPRCGTSFLLMVMVVSILIFSLLPHHLPFEYKVASRMAFLPLIAGVSYEIIRFSDQRRQSPGIQVFIKPGLWLQRLTAREPSDPQIEVAICALRAVLELEGGKIREHHV
ncbi:MAG: DUF1385 domain-containing protein [Thermodesulfobacteriota bacterium]